MKGIVQTNENLESDGESWNRSCKIPLIAPFFAAGAISRRRSAINCPNLSSES